MGKKICCALPFKFNCNKISKARIIFNIVDIPLFTQRQGNSVDKKCINSNF